MKKLFFWAVIAFAAVFSACSDSYDDTELHNELNNLKDRVAKLEAWQKQVNSDVAALKAIAESLDGAKFITNVETVAEGYKITFSDGQTVTVKHGDKGEQGEQGEQGNTPAIGIAEEDGVYYWTLDGEWLLDAQGNKVPAQGAKGDQGEQGPAGEQGPQGEQGLTPEFKIENGHWYVRFGEGEWQDLGEAKGEQGDSFFKDVKVGEDSVVFTMADGTEFTVPFVANAKFSDIQSLKFVPEYADNMGSVLFSTKEDATIEMNFEVLPKKYAAVIAANAEAVALKAVYTETRGSVEFIDLAVTAVEADVENGVVCVKASASALSDEFFAGTQTASVRFSVEDEESGVASGYVPVVPMFQMTLEADRGELYQGITLKWNAAPGAASYKVSANGVEIAEALTAAEYTYAEGTLTEALNDFKVVALDAAGDKVAEVELEDVPVWTLTGVREPVLDVDKMAAGTLYFDKTIDLGGVAVKMTVDFVNAAGEVVATATYDKLDETTHDNYDTNLKAYNIPGQVTGNGANGGRFTYNFFGRFILESAVHQWIWTGAVETEGHNIPELPVGEYTIKYTAEYYPIVNAYWSRSGQYDPTQYADELAVVGGDASAINATVRVHYPNGADDVLQTPIARKGEVADKYVVEMKATASSNGVLDGANISWSAVAGASGYEILANGEKLADVGADVTTYELRDATAAKYTFEVKATGTSCSATTEEVGIYSVKDWKEPTFEWNGKRMIVHDLTGVNAEGQGYAYGGAITNENDTSKSTIEIYNEAGEKLYTLTNGTGQGTLKAWAGYGRWALNAQEDRKDWVWVNHATGEETKEVDIASAWMPAGKYTIKWTIGYVLCKNAYYVNADSEANAVPKAEANRMWFGPKDAPYSTNVCYTDDTHSAVMIVAKSGETAYEVVAPESLDLVVKVDGLYQGAKLSWNKILGATNYEVLVDGEKVADTAETSYVVENLTEKHFYSFTVKCAGMDDSTVENVEVFTLANWQEPELQFNQQEDGNFEVKAVGLMNTNYAYAGGATITLSKDGEVVYSLANNTGDGTLIAWAGYKRWALNAQDNRVDWKWTVGGVEEANECKTHFIAPGTYDVAWQWDYVVNKNGTWATSNNGFIPQENKEGATHVYFSNGVADVLTKDGAPVRFQKSGTQTLTVASNIILNPQANVAGLYQGMKLTWNPSDAVASYAIGYGKDSVEETVEIGEPVTEYTLEGLDKYNKYYVKLTAFDAEGAELKSEELKDVEVFTMVNWQEPELQFNLQDDGTYQVVATGLVDLNYAYAGGATITFTKDGAEVYKLVNNTPDGTLIAWAGYKRWALGAQENRKDWKWTVNGVEEANEVNKHAIEPGTYDIAWQWDYVLNKNGQWKTAADGQVVETKAEAGVVYFANGVADILQKDNVIIRQTKNGTTTLTIEEPVTGPQKVTVAEFLAAPEGDTMYELTGVITSCYNTTYGNFYLKDATAEVLIYGLCSPEGAQKYWAASGAKVGDTITVQTVRTSYNGSPQGKDALFVSLVPFTSVASEWGIVGDLNGWAAPDVPLMTTWKSDKLFVAEGVEIASGSFKIRANGEWNDAKNYGLSVAGKIYADKYYSLLNGAGSQNATPMDYGTYDVWFDLENERVALMTPGKDYAEAENGGEPVVVVEGLTDHTWGMIGSFEASNNWTTDVAMAIEGDYAVAKNVTLANGNEFKFRADGAWTLSYGSACDVNVGEVYKTYNNGNNMKFVGEDGAYDIYFSMVDASFYLKAHASATVATWESDAQGWANAKVVKDTAWAIDDNVTVTFKQGSASTAPTFYSAEGSVRLYQNGATMEIAAANNMTIKSITLSFANNHYYIKADSGEFSAEGATRTWTGEAAKVLFTTTGTDKDHRAYVTAIEVTYE
ncbi:MAG: hypothetical protein E7133_04095 [Rikenellaceae bacterium]|nr:hypothetical protein [Rikenellaceae bacterium]